MPVNGKNDKQIHSQWEEVTPERAQRWLDEANTRNRRKSPTRISRLARDIKHNRYVETHQGIAFDTSGVLVDGQKRLEAIIESGKAIRLLVTYNLSPKARAVVDDIQQRSLADSYLFHRNGTISTMQASTSKFMMDSTLNCKATRQEELAFFDAHNAAIDWTCNTFCKHVKKVRVAPVLAAITRAYYTHDKTRLAEFCERLMDGTATNPGDRAAMMLRDFLKDGDYGSTPGKRLAYGYIEWALDRFLKRDARAKRIAFVGHELFPLPEEFRKLEQKRVPAPVIDTRPLLQA